MGGEDGLKEVEFFQNLGVDPQKGLSQEEAENRLKKYGLNQLEEKEETLFKRIAKRFIGPIPFMIETAAILSLAVGRMSDFSIIMAMLLVNAFVDFYQESKALNAIKVLKQKLAKRALVLRDGKWSEVDAKYLVLGDVVKLKIGDIVPADVRLIGGGGFLLVDQSALTGESLPVEKSKGDEVYANSIIKQGEMIGVVVATAKNTYFGTTVSLVAKAEREEKSHFQKMVIKVGDFLIALTIVMIIFILAVGILRHEPFIDLLTFSLVLTISAIPVAMPAVLTVTMAIGAVSLAKKQAVVSRLAAIEELAGMDVLCVDKTGTLTQNRMTIAEPFAAAGYSVDDLMIYAALASKKENNDPIEAPIFEYIENKKIEDKLKGHALLDFQPFDPKSKRTEAKLKTDKGIIIVSKGAPQVILKLSDLEKDDVDKLSGVVSEFASKGFRSLGVAYKNEGEEKFRFVGIIPLYDPPKEDAKQAIEEAKAKGVDVKMITGDNRAIAKYIASILGIGEKIEDIRELKGESIEEYLVLAKIITKTLAKKLKPDFSETQINDMAEDIISKVKEELLSTELAKGVVKRHESEIIKIIEQANGFAEVYPEDKYFVIEKLQKADHIVGMTGDGVNDAPALKKADAGIAVSRSTDAARAAADIVLLNSGIRIIVDAINEARVIFERMKSYATFRIAETIRIIIFMTLSIVLFNFYPITAIMIVVLALLNDIPILTIAYDNTRISQTPVRWDMREVLVLSSWLGVAGVLSSFALFVYLMKYMHLPLEFVQSVFFAKLVIAGHGTIYNTRISDWFFKKPYPSLTLFLATFSSRVAGTIIAVYGFGLMEPIGWKWAIAMWIYALAWFVFNDAVKMAVLAYYRKRLAISVL
ncbi:plasma-membrane proton-efflux P-type ATPase [Hippea maritima]|uniref:Plasma-membrane proton-efflux P-type ATPase n=1 Tax=Hippea maritima (strain ATCC 700847 / DSM 10411 / MH2) TaxID=760142 RepID=F2LX54_HIPMA|nr:plasma-membrane proton-efflux P-type ATPase [Hippea maritima]AEA33112.1 plasma-membrane proton-efflux P-type ATPase [Hippea maritima DSM 10411]